MFAKTSKSSINLVICCKFFSLHDFVTALPIQTNRRSNLTLIGHGQPRAIIYINFVDLKSPMLHAKLKDHRTSGFREILCVETCVNCCDRLHLSAIGDAVIMICNACSSLFLV